ncbi:squalene synthase HpnC [Rhodoferax sp.]|uniref:squalene synthase HpnC n=1 Tax=Rhodoferax sp. TaxID=50421 RepID=UPI0039B825CE
MAESTQALPVKHYENFPVASWLCPPRLRAPIAAIYHFARCADDLADEGDAQAAQRLSDLQAFQADLSACAERRPHSGRWPVVFDTLGPVIVRFELPVTPLTDLLEAFTQDVRYTAARRRYQDDAELLDYCRRSANPIGRLLLHLYGVHDERSLKQSDQICTALQLVNFWQDLSVDTPRSRWYPSRQSMAALAVVDADLLGHGNTARAALLIEAYCAQARSLMLAGASLALRIPGRAGWELRLVVQGGLRILDKIQTMHHETWRARPKLAWVDVPLLLWRAARMRPTSASRE